ncbi:NAP1, partial [Symbiodinium sp. CCMP2456]
MTKVVDTKVVFERTESLHFCGEGTGQGWPATGREEKTSQEGRCRPSRLLAASQLKPEQGKLEKPVKPEKASLPGCLASREALLKQRLAFFADAQGRHRALNLASATLQVWKQNVASRRLLAAQSDAAFYKKRLQEKCASACQQAAARRWAFEAGALAAASRTALQCRCLQAWRSLARARFRDVSAEEYSSLLTAHLEHNERCLRVLEAWAVGLEASLVRVCFNAWSKQKAHRSAASAAFAFERRRKRTCLIGVLRSWARLRRSERGSALQEASAKARRQAVAILRFWKLQVEIARRRAAQAAECRAAILSCRGRMLTKLCIMAWRLFQSARQMRRETE